MSTNVKNKSLLYATLSIVLMITAGFLLSFVINELCGYQTEIASLTLSLLAVFIFFVGTSVMAHSVRKVKTHYSRDNIDFVVHLAFLLIGAGTLLLCFNTGALENQAWKKFIFSWPMLIFAIGSISICKFHFISGILLVGIGKFFLIAKARLIYPDNNQVEQLISYFWPVMIIVLGIAILAYFIMRPKHNIKTHCKTSWNDDFKTEESENNDGKINFKVICSGTEQVILDPIFRGGTIEATLGGVELDLRRTTLPEGDTFLYINAVLGGVEIKAPDTWDIEIKSNSFAGGVSDDRKKWTEKDPSRKLIIVAKCTLGGITIC